jgi:hypothetical protein
MQKLPGCVSQVKVRLFRRYMSNKVSAVARGCNSNAQGGLVVGTRSRLKCHTGMDGWCRWIVTNAESRLHLVDASSGTRKLNPGYRLTHGETSSLFPRSPIGALNTEQVSPIPSTVFHHSSITRLFRGREMFILGRVTRRIGISDIYTSRISPGGNQ